MRQLTAKQKKVIDKWIQTQVNKVEYIESPFTQHRYGLSVDDLPAEIFAELEQINDTEILWQEANRYISDESFKIANKR